jgi:hypothetical protein
MHPDQKLLGRAGELLRPPDIGLGRSRSSSIDRRAVGPAPGVGFLTGCKLGVQSRLRGRHLTEPGAYSLPAAHDPIFPPGAKVDAVALAWAVMEGAG